MQLDLQALAQRGPMHFVGVCGAGMSALAELAIHAGARVTGCDTHLNASAERLRRLGAEIWQGHDPGHVEHAGAVIVTAAVPLETPELGAARDLQLPVLKRAHVLGSIVNRGTLIAVAGTHGKTTTTAMAATILDEAGLAPTAFVGGHVPGWDGGLRIGGERFYVVEADEFDRSFLTLRPAVAVVTTLEADHLDIYGTLEGVQEAFAEFLALLPRKGCAVICADDHGARSIAARVRTEVVLYGIDDTHARLRAINIENRGRSSRFTVTDHGEELGEILLGVPGLHNVRNALAAIGAARSVQAPFDAAQRALARFGGVGRRFQEIGRADNIVIVDDYAHHPTEIQVTLAAARSAYASRRLIAVFQPHLYSRTRDFATAFGAALTQADEVLVTDVYAAREAPIPGVSGAVVARAAGARARFIADAEALHTELLQTLRGGDVCVFMGAGDIDALASRVLRSLRGEP